MLDDLYFWEFEFRGVHESVRWEEGHIFVSPYEPNYLLSCDLHKQTLSVRSCDER